MNTINFFKYLETRKGIPIPWKVRLIENLPLTEEDLEVRGFLDLSGTKITSLPEGLKVEGSLDLTDSKIKSLPKDLEIGENLFLGSTEITSLPEDLRVGRNLFLAYTPLSETYTREQIRKMCPGIKGRIVLDNEYYQFV